jgi:hypothetical protein
LRRLYISRGTHVVIDADFGVGWRHRRHARGPWHRAGPTWAADFTSNGREGTVVFDLATFKTIKKVPVGDNRCDTFDPATKRVFTFAAAATMRLRLTPPPAKSSARFRSR